MKGPHPRLSSIVHDDREEWTVDALCAALDHFAPAPEKPDTTNPTPATPSITTLLPAVEKELVRLDCPALGERATSRIGSRPFGMVSQARRTPRANRVHH